jgi:hypothetical protein
MMQVPTATSGACILYNSRLKFVISGNIIMDVLVFLYRLSYWHRMRSTSHSYC